MGFTGVEYTDFSGWSTAEVCAFARSLDGEAVAADGRAVAAAAERLADSLAELEADVGRLRDRWQGEAADGAFDRIARFVAASYDAGASAGTLAGAVDDLAGIAARTRTEFADPPTSTDMWNRAAERAAVAAALRSRYSEPIAAANGGLSEHPVAAAPVFTWILPMDLTKRDAADGESVADTASSGETAGTGADGTEGAGSGAADRAADAGGAGAGPPGGGAAVPASAARVASGGAEQGAIAGQGAAAGSAHGAGAAGGTARAPGSNVPAGFGPWATGVTPSSGTVSAGKASGGKASGASAGGDPSDADADAEFAATPLLTSAGSPGPGWSGAGARVPGGALGSAAPGSGVGAGGVPRTASPLGLRGAPQAPAVGGASPSAGGGRAGGVMPGARPSTTPMAIPPAAAAGQRGGGRDGEHRAPGYLIGRENGEEMVGELPLVGPTVIGEWPGPRVSGR
ncbi:hypothetical protein [Tsukamurella soli]|uniref:hypothetical protein n=1 Tax=Tsukamurella soli TaxID=644556 RepID=UPI00362432CD